jgi:hypothetical protein
MRSPYPHPPASTSSSHRLVDTRLTQLMIQASPRPPGKANLGLPSFEFSAPVAAFPIGSVAGRLRKALHAIDIHIAETIDQARLLPKAAWKLKTAVKVLTTEVR